MSRANSKTYLVLCVQLEHNLERFLSLPGLSTVLFHAVPTFAKRLVYFFIIYFLFGDFFFSLFGYSPVLVGLCMLVCVSVCVCVGTLVPFETSSPFLNSIVEITRKHGNSEIHSNHGHYDIRNNHVRCRCSPRSNKIASA